MSNPEVLRSIDQAQMEFHQLAMRELERRRMQQELEERVIWGPEPERRSRGPFLLDELGMMPSPRPDHNRPVPTSLIDEMRPYQHEQNIRRELFEYKEPKPVYQLISDEDLTFFGFERCHDPYLGLVYKSQLTYLKEEITSSTWSQDYQYNTEVVEKERFVYYVQNNRLYDYKNPDRRGYIKDIYEFIEFINDRGDFEGKAEKQLNRNKGIYSQLGNSERVNYNRGDFNLGTLRDSFGSLFAQPRNDRRVRIQTGAEGMQAFSDALRDQASVNIWSQSPINSNPLMQMDVPSNTYHSTEDGRFTWNVPAELSVTGEGSSARPIIFDTSAAIQPGQLGIFNLPDAQGSING